MAKKKAGQQKVNSVKSSNFLPSVFQTELNKSWLDSTLDQMVSKGPLENVHGYIGSKDGKVAVAGDDYLENKETKNQLKPALVSYNKQKELTNAITFDDIANSINTNFSTYNYNSAYSSNRYSFNPPINIDKFINHTNYRWIPELPVYESIWTGASKNPITDIENGKSTLTDDNNTFVVENQMLIKFTDSGWDASVLNKTYIVVGSVGKHKLYEYIDENDIRVYNNTVMHTEDTDGAWFNEILYNAEINAASGSPLQLVSAYNTTASNRLPFFDGFNFPQLESNSTQLINNMLVRFTGSWTHTGITNSTAIFSLQILEANGGILSVDNISSADALRTAGTYNGVTSTSNKGETFNITIDSTGAALIVVVNPGYGYKNTPTQDTITIADTKLGSGGAADLTFKVATIGNIGDVHIAPADDDEIALANTTLSPNYNLMYDEGYAVNPQKDYIVIAKDDSFQTAWSRANHWVNISTIKKLQELIPTYDFTEIKNVKRKAQRPIIEYNSGIELWNHAESNGGTYLGCVHGLEQATATPLTVGHKYIYIDNSDINDRIYTVTSGTDTFESLTANDTFSVKYTNQPHWVEADGYYNGTKIILAQQKTKINQYPLYKFFNTEGESLEGGCNKSFTGDKLFGYKLGTGANDTELGFPLSYKDTPKGAEYEFENFILTHKYYTNHSNAEYSKATYSKEQVGYNFFKQNNVLKTIYTPAGDNAGASETAQYKVDTVDSPLVIPHGYNNWRTQPTYVIHNVNNNILITTEHNNGTCNSIQIGNAELYTVGESQTIVFENLTSQNLKIISHGVDIETTAIPEISFTRTGNKITLVTSASSNDTYFDICAYGTTVLQSFIVTQDCDNPLYKLTVNGKNIDSAKTTVSATTISVDESVLAVNDLVDLSWRNNDLANKTTNMSLPDVHIHNTANAVIETFTISETINHWTDKLNTMPGFNGTMLSDNNFASIPHTTQYGGTIFVHENSSAMHDINYSNKHVSITGALLEQGKEFDAFRTRLSAQARRQFVAGANSIQELADATLDEIIRNKQKNKLYSTSNMVYGDLANQQTFILEGLAPTLDFTKTFKTRFIFNGDTNIRDHVYVYLTEHDGNDKQVRRLLLKDIDYKFLGDTVILTLDYESTLDSVFTKPKVEIYHIKMDEASFVPPSMVKLGLAYGVEPQVNNGILYTHDGKEISVTNETSLIDINSTTFDPANAVIYEIEKRIYAGLVKEDYMYNDENRGKDRFSSPVEYLPTDHSSTWYALNDLNNYVEKYYYTWALQNKITSLNTANYYDSADSFTWNYGTLSFGNESMPGHWKGAYIHLFGTCTPHLTPWHMLGHAFKPTWWDANYDWRTTVNGGDDTKRDALINALTKGIVSNPSTATTHIVRNARYTWNWTTRCPVTTTGTLEDASTVLDPTSLLSNVDKSQDFVFGDWGPTEAQWRQSAEGQSVLLDAILKLNPAKAWTDFFQPGVISKNISVIANINHYTEVMPSAKDYKIPGKIYENSIESLTLNNESANTLESTGYFKILDDNLSTIAKARYRFTTPGATGSTEALSLIDRGLNFTGHPIVSYHGSDSVTNTLNVSIKLQQIPFTANGIAQAQYNYVVRNSIEISLEDLYTTLITKLQAKLNGFTSKHLLNISAETSSMGDITLGMQDFNVSMYEGAVNKLITASSVVVTKTLAGYKVKGFNNNTREFKFHEPNLISSVDYTTQDVSGQTIRRYNKFVTTPSIVEYDAEFEKIQDTYNFIRGYWNWMNTQGYEHEYNGDVSAIDFVEWTLTATVGSEITLQIGRQIKFSSTTGHVYEYNRLKYNSNDILALDSSRIDNSNLGIKRIDGKVTIEAKDKQMIASTTSAVVDYEHIIIFENKTKLGVNIFDDIKNNKQERFLLDGQRTQQWTGKKKAPGYLILDDSIVQNFDSAVQSVDDMYRTDVDEFNPSFSKAKDLTLGNVEGQLLDNLGINKNVLTKYYQGMIKEKGTKGAIEHIGKSDILHNNETNISAYEQYMFRQSHLGNDDFENALEVEIVSSDVFSSPQMITFDQASTESNVIVASNGKIVNDKSMTFDTLDYDNSVSDILTGGEALASETKYSILNSNQLSTVFDSTEDYATTPTWSPTVSFKKGDQVRYRGVLWTCNVDYTGLDVTSPIIEATSTLATADREIDFGTVANIAGTTATISKTDTEFNDIVATGSSFTPFNDAETLSIGYPLSMATITFNKKEVVPTVTGPAEIFANSGPPSLSDVTGRLITINISTSGSSTNHTVNFDTTPADLTENFTGDGVGDTFTIGTALSGSTYGVSNVTVAGVSTTAFTVLGQSLTFTTPPALNDAIVVTLEHVPDQMSASQVVARINSQVTDSRFTASLDTSGVFDRLLLSYGGLASDNLTAELTLNAGSSNNELGFITDPINGQKGPIPQTISNIVNSVNLTVEEVRDQINGTATLSPTITATVVSGNLVLTDTDGSNALMLSDGLGSTLTYLGLNASYPTTTTPVNRKATFSEAVADIQAALTAASITDVSILVVGNQIKITSTASSLSLGDTTFNSQVGLPTGIIDAAVGNVDNVWDSDHAAKFTAIVDDPALYNILIADDSDFKIESSGQIVTKFWSWNVLQVTQHSTTPLYSLPSAVANALTVAAGGQATTCGICAGVSSKDGNDAEITTNVPHGLQVGDWVQLLNTDTTPTIDGIHKVTKVDSNDNQIFYIDEFIEECGNAQSIMPLVTTRFKNIDQQNGDGTSIYNNITGAENTARWNIPVGANTFVSNLETFAEAPKDYLRGTYVYTKSIGKIKTSADVLVIGNLYTILTNADNTDFTLIGAANNAIGTIFKATGTTIPGAGTVITDLVRVNKVRPTNRDIDSVIIYNHKENQSRVQLEAWDPMRKIIPGIAEKNLDYINFSDNAIYTTSTDDNYIADLDNAWGMEQVGTRWWDISQARYYDYDQGNLAYKTTQWGALYPDADIVVWEWIRSNVAPDDYADAVTNSTEVFGTIASGEAYSIYDSVAKETLYYYTTEKQYNTETGSYSDIYYYWVKNKTSITDTRTLSAFDVTNIIKNPSASGISWFAVAGANEIIIDNISYYVDDENTVLQINKAGNKYNSHNEWTLIAKDSDLIPEYYVNAMKLNFAGVDSNGVSIPHSLLHRFNRYGDDMSIGQTWFDNLPEARRNAIVTLNTQFKHINLKDEFEGTWDKTLKAKNFPTLLWKWIDYTLKSYTGTYTHTKIIKTYAELNTIDRAYHSVVKIRIFDEIDAVDRSEVYAYNDSTSMWELVLKKNNTIEFDEKLLSAVGGWDKNIWDSTPFDFANIADYWETLMDALNNDIFVNYHKHQMNTFFFSVIHYILSSFSQTTWIRKTTYVRLEFTDAINTVAKKYTKNKLNNVIGYIQEVKPFHTKSSTVLTKHTHIDEIGLSVTETPQTIITVKPQSYDAVYGGSDTYVGADFTDTTFIDSITGEGSDVYAGPDFISPEEFNYTTTGHNRNSLVEIKPLELLRINVQTNASGSTHANDSLTFAHIQDYSGYVNTYALTEAKETTIATNPLTIDSTTITVASTAAFSSVGIAYVNGELIEYVVADATTLGITKRELAGTFKVLASVGDSITDVTNSKITFANEDPSHYQYNDLGDTILNSPGSTQAQELQTLGKGIEL